MEVTSTGATPATTDASPKSGKKAASGFSALLAAMDKAGKGETGRSASHDALGRLHAPARSAKNVVHAQTPDKNVDLEKNVVDPKTAVDPGSPEAIARASDRTISGNGNVAVSTLGAEATAPLPASEKPASSTVKADSNQVISAQTAAAPLKGTRPDDPAAAKPRTESSEKAGSQPANVAQSQRAVLPAQITPVVVKDGLDGAMQLATVSKGVKADKKASEPDLPAAVDAVRSRGDDLLPAQTAVAANLLAFATATPGSVGTTAREVASAGRERSAGTTRGANAADAALLEKTKVEEESADLPAGAFERHLQAASNKVAVTPAAAPSAPYEVAIPVGQQGWSDAISKTMVSMLKDGVTEAVVSINPEHLGPVDIKISMEKGTVNVDFFSPYAEVREALADGADQLQARFAEAGVRLERVESHDSLPAMKEEFAQDRGGKEEQPSGRQDQRRDSRKENSWMAQVLAEDQDI